MGGDADETIRPAHRSAMVHCTLTSHQVQRLLLCVWGGGGRKGGERKGEGERGGGEGGGGR